jgi:hypothetical protein
MRITLIGILLVASFAARSQESEDVSDVMAKETCECFQKKTNGKFDDVDKATEELGVCLVNSYFAHEEAASKVFKIDEWNEEAGEIIGQKVGVKMLKYCPDLIVALGAADSGEEEEESSDEIVLEGKVQALEEAEFVTIKLKGNDNNLYRLMWITYFDGSEDFESNPKKLIGKNVTVTVVEINCYFAKDKKYSSVKQIVGLKVN